MTLRNESITGMMQKCRSGVAQKIP